MWVSFVVSCLFSSDRCDFMVVWYCVLINVGYLDWKCYIMLFIMCVVLVFVGGMVDVGVRFCLCRVGGMFMLGVLVDVGGFVVGVVVGVVFVSLIIFVRMGMLLFVWDLG